MFIFLSRWRKIINITAPTTDINKACKASEEIFRKTFSLSAKNSHINLLSPYGISIMKYVFESVLYFFFLFRYIATAAKIKAVSASHNCTGKTL